jgi:hypothetical protein
MADFAADHSEATGDVIDEMIRTATLELFQAEAPALTFARGRRDSPRPGSKPFGLGACVRFSGAGGAGFLALGCAEDFRAGADGPQIANVAWAVERVEGLARRIEKRLRQYGIAVRFEAPEALSELDGPGSDTPCLRTTQLFDGANGELFVHLAGQLDIERIANAGDVPLRDEGDIILF